MVGKNSTSDKPEVRPGVWQKYNIRQTGNETKWLTKIVHQTNRKLDHIMSVINLSFTRLV